MYGGTISRNREDGGRTSLGGRGVREVRVPFWSNSYRNAFFDSHVRYQVGSWINTLRVLRMGLSEEANFRVIHI